MEWDALLLSRLQFAFTIGFHIIFPAFTIGLASFLAMLEGLWLTTKKPLFRNLYLFWVKIFALSFGMGVVSGVVMSYQFGTNWSVFSSQVGSVIGPLLGYEVLTAFFLEASFLGIMLFGWKKVGPKLHFFATCTVAVGTLISAFWILSANSWMQTPTGFEMIDGRAHALDWWAVIFNPSFPYRLTHMLLASGLTASFLIAGLSAWRWLRGDRGADVRVALRAGVIVAAVLIPLQILAGDFHGLNTLKHQPAKIAAIEGVWHDERGAPLLLFAWPDEQARENRYAVGIPNGASLILRHSADGEIRGLEEFEGAHPPVAPVFWAFRIMVGVGMLMLAVSWLSAWQSRKQGLLKPWLARVLVAMSFSGWIATLAGWYVTEIGRQPYLVYGVLLTKDAASATAAPIIGLSLGMYLTLYVVLILSYISVLFYLARHAHKKYSPIAIEEAKI